MDDSVRADLVRRVIERTPPRTGTEKRQVVADRARQVLLQILARSEPRGLDLTASDAGRVLDEVYLELRLF